MKRRAFYIDVSRRQPFVVQSNRSNELPLASLTDAELDQLCDIAAGQLRRGIVEDHDAVAEYRATLYFLQRWSDRAATQSATATDRNAQARTRTATFPQGTGRSA